MEKARTKPVALVVTDLDGTLLTDDKLVSDANREAIQNLKNHGILFGVISGRPVESSYVLNDKTWHLGKSLSILGGMNGGAILDCRTGEKDKYGQLDGYRIWDVIQHFRDLPDLHFEVMVGNTQYVEYVTPETLAIAELFGEKEVIVDMEEFLKNNRVDKLIIRSTAEDQPAVIERSKTFQPEGLVCFPTSDVLFEYCHPDINKGFGLQKICEHYGIPLENVVAFGDQSNDIEMLTLAGTSVAMKNATPPARAVADVISEYTNNEDALAHYINEVIIPAAEGRLESHE